MTVRSVLFVLLSNSFREPNRWEEMEKGSCVYLQSIMPLHRIPGCQLYSVASYFMAFLFKSNA